MGCYCLRRRLGVGRHLHEPSRRLDELEELLIGPDIRFAVAPAALDVYPSATTFLHARWSRREGRTTLPASSGLATGESGRRTSEFDLRGRGCGNVAERRREGEGARGVHRLGRRPVGHSQAQVRVLQSIVLVLRLRIFRIVLLLDERRRKCGRARQRGEGVRAGPEGGQHRRSEQRGKRHARHHR